jgi:hypothetical protein
VTRPLEKFRKWRHRNKKRSRSKTSAQAVPENNAPRDEKAFFELLEWPVAALGWIFVSAGLFVGVFQSTGFRFASTDIDPGGTLWGAVGYLGVGASLLGVSLAIKIYGSQRVGNSMRAIDQKVLLDAIHSKATLAASSAASAASEARLQRQVVESVVFGVGAKEWARLAESRLTEAERRALRRKDPFPEESSTSLAGSVPAEFSGRKGAFVDATVVPLGVLGDLVSHWKEEGQSGSWPVGYLLGAFRETGGGRNYPWILVFEKPNGDRRAWRLFRGGKGRRGKPPVVTVLDPRAIILNPKN